ncbi:MAG: hypothetical protein GY863_08770, partial [bacterium]|nr:hypothetical protein [bacterium]
DHHRVIQIFKEIYKSKWITSGRSKGGMAALFHKYYYPEDAEATVAYVAPIMIGLQDPRFYDFLEKKGTEELRQRIRNIQKTLLRRKNDILPIFKEYAKNDGINYSIDPEIVFEYMVAAYPFSFWQGKKNPDSIPDSTSTDIELIDHLSSIVSFSTYSVSTLNSDAPLIYQAITEFGYHGFPIEHLKGLLTALPNPEYSIFAPKDAEAEFNPEIMKNVLNYLENEGDNIIYLYGEYDPWTSCAVEPDKELDALKIIVSGVSHKFDIDDLPEGDKAALYSKLEDWLSIIIRR